MVVSKMEQSTKKVFKYKTKGGGGVKTVTAHVTEDFYKKVRHYAVDKGVSVGKLIRELLEKELKSKKEQTH